MNQYQATAEDGVQATIVAGDMETACRVYNEEKGEDALLMQCTKKGVLYEAETADVTFETTVYDETGAAASACSATPESYTVEAGSKLVFTAKAGEGWSFVKWTVDGEDASTDEVALLTIPSSTSTVAIQAVFAVDATEDSDE